VSHSVEEKRFSAEVERTRHIISYEDKVSKFDKIKVSKRFQFQLKKLKRHFNAKGKRFFPVF
jgi:hypothetical protein